MKRLHLFSFFQTDQILCQQFSLLNGNLCQLGMSVRIIFVTGKDTQVTNRKYIIRTFYPVKSIYFDTASTTDSSCIHISKRNSGNSAYPNESTGSNLTAIFKCHFMVTIIRNTLIQKNIDSHFAQELLRMAR